MNKNTIILLVESINEKLRENHIYADVWANDPDIFGTASIFVEINSGDWKHDHIHTVNIIKSVLDDRFVNHFENVTKSDGSDTYSAIHEFAFKLNSDPKIYL